MDILAVMTVRKNNWFLGQPKKSGTQASIELLDENGSNASVDSNVFISLRFTCLKENLCPAPPAIKNKKRVHR